MDLLSVLSWILLGCSVIILCVFLLGKVVEHDLEAQQAGKVSKWGAALRFTTYFVLAIYWIQEVDFLLAKAGILILGISVAVAAEAAHIKSLKKQSKSVKETEW